MKSIFSYQSYRPFLKDAFTQAKSASPGINLATYSKKFGISSSGLNMIFSGQRNLTIENLHGFARGLGLSRSEHEYFEALVLREQADGDEFVERYYSRRLKEFAKAARVKNVRVADRFLLNEWFVPALLIYLMDFELKNNGGLVDRLDLAAISKRFQIPQETVSQLISGFLKSGLLHIDDEHEVHVVFDRLTAQVPQKKYLKAVLNEVNKRIESDFEASGTLFRAFVFSIRRSALSELRSELLSVYEKYFSEVSANPDENALVQSLVGVFPIF